MMPEQQAAPANCVIYARYSSKLQNEKSIEDQVALCRDRANQHGWNVLEVYADRAKSGTTTHGRQNLQRLVKDAQSAKFSIVLTEGLDRISRNQGDTAYFYQTMMFYDIGIYSLSDAGFINEMHVSFKGLQHSMFSKELGLKTRRGQVGTVRRGLISGSVAYGYRVYRSVKVPSGGREINPDEAAIVRRIFEEYAAGRSSYQISAKLNEDGIPGGEGKKWRPSTIVGSSVRRMGILRNELYRGRNVWGKNQNRRIPNGGRTNRPAPESALEIKEVPELRIVSDELWNTVQSRLASLRVVRLPGRKPPKYLLSRRIFCSICGSAYAVADGKKCACTGHTAMGICTNRRRVDRAKLEEAVLDAISTQLCEPSLLSTYVAEYIEARRKAVGEARHITSTLAKNCESLIKQRDRLFDAFTKGETVGPASAFLMQKMNQLTSELEKAQGELEAAQNATVPSLTIEGAVKRLQAQISDLRAELDGDSAEATYARNAIRAIVSKVIIHPLGDPERKGGGPVEIRMEGPLATLIALAEGDAKRVVQLDASPHIQLDHAITWCLTVNPSLAQNLAGQPLKGRNKGFRDAPLILANLRQAKAPMTALQLANVIFQEEGGHAGSDRINYLSKRARACLHSLKSDGLVTAVTLHGKEHQGWVLVEMASEVQKAITCTLTGRHKDAPAIFSLLRDAAAPLSTTEIVELIASASREGRESFKSVRSRVNACLKYHRLEGSLIARQKPGSSGNVWILAERLAEFPLPAPKPLPKIYAADQAEVFDVLRSAPGILTAPEIVNQVAAKNSGKGLSIRAWQIRVYRVLRHHRSAGQVEAVIVSGKKAMGWTLVGADHQPWGIEAHTAPCTILEALSDKALTTKEIVAFAKGADKLNEAAIYDRVWRRLDVHRRAGRIFSERIPTTSGSTLQWSLVGRSKIDHFPSNYPTS